MKGHKKGGGMAKREEKLRKNTKAKLFFR